MSGSRADYERLVRAWERDATFQARRRAGGDLHKPSGEMILKARMELARAAIRCGYVEPKNIYADTPNIPEWAERRVRLFLAQMGPQYAEPAL